MNKHLSIITLFLVFNVTAFSQVIITTSGSTYTQDFNSLANTGTSSVVPTGWAFVEAGSGANTTYGADDGTSASGNTMSYGASSASERAFGSLVSGSVKPTIGVLFSNNTGGAINSITVTYAGEQWRVGVLNREDRLDFQYSLDATSLSSGTWTDENNLDFARTVTSGAIGAVDGNLAGNRVQISYTITGLNISSGSSFWFRWQDFDVSGIDDGLAVDDFSAGFNLNPQAPCAQPLAQPSGLNLTASPTTISGSFTAASPVPNEYLVVRSLNSTLSSSPVDGIVYGPNDLLGGGTVVSRTSTTIFTDVNLSASTVYYYFIFSLNNEDCAGGPNYLEASPLTANVSTSALPACVTPPSSPSAIMLTPANTLISASFTGVTGNNNYLSVISTASSLSASPVNGTTYTQGQSFGGGTVIAFNSNLNFTASGLVANTTYYVFVFAANVECTGAPFYNNTAGTASATTTNITNGIPPGYYNSANGLTCQPLKTALRDIAANGAVQLTYTPGVWNAFQYTDLKRNDANTAFVIWDIYSDNPAGPDPYTYTFGTDQCGSYSGEGSCYNREHSTPSSWFGAAYPMYSDVNHLYPTDGVVNNIRGNYPYGEVTTATKTTLNGSKLGSGTNFGYTATFFEPINEYKGDLARTSLYMATRYENEIIANNWAGNGNANEVFLSTTNDSIAANRKLQIYDAWYLKEMFKWHNQDPVSQKEIDRNNAVYYQSGQNNRNPYIDHPEYAYLVFQCTGAIPVTIFDFKVAKTSNGAVLSWYATYETTFSRYDIERSTDAVHFSIVGQVPGRNLANYIFDDNNLPQAATLYYRLKMVDQDGSFTYSPVVTLRLRNIVENIIYPNPARNNFTLQLDKALTAAAVLVIRDITGREVKKILVPGGKQYITGDIKELPSGKYFLTLSTGFILSQQTLVIIR
ncbi:MAG: endonuclease [Ferruginibacter sp.]